MTIFEPEREAKPQFTSSAHSNNISVPSESASNSHSTAKDGSEVPGTENESIYAQHVFIRSFKFHPALPIRIDYEAKGFKTEIVSGLVLCNCEYQKSTII